MVVFAVKSLMYGEANAPTVPIALIHPKARDSILEGNS
jgi:hypothetical protein